MFMEIFVWIEMFLLLLQDWLKQTLIANLWKTLLTPTTWMDYTSHMCGSIWEKVILVNGGRDSFATIAKLGMIHNGAVIDSWPQTNFLVRKSQVWFDQFDISVMWVYSLISNDAWMNNRLSCCIYCTADRWMGVQHSKRLVSNRRALFRCIFWLEEVRHKNKGWALSKYDTIISLVEFQVGVNYRSLHESCFCRNVASLNSVACSSRRNQPWESDWATCHHVGRSAVSPFAFPSSPSLWNWASVEMTVPSGESRTHRWKDSTASGHK